MYVASASASEFLASPLSYTKLRGEPYKSEPIHEHISLFSDWSRAKQHVAKFWSLIPNNMSTGPSTGKLEELVPFVPLDEIPGIVATFVQLWLELP